MATKILAARMVVRAGIPMVIASGKKPDALARVIRGQEEGTLFLPRRDKLKGHKKWIAFFNHVRGRVCVDDGAREALLDSKGSLLLKGVTKVEGQFTAEDVISICDQNGVEFARGQIHTSADELRRILGTPPEVINRDDLVIL
jgi:glutamate 5-kinase